MKHFLIILISFTASIAQAEQYQRTSSVTAHWKSWHGLTEKQGEVDMSCNIKGDCFDFATTFDSVDRYSNGWCRFDIGGYGLSDTIFGGIAKPTFYKNGKSVVGNATYLSFRCTRK